MKKVIIENKTVAVEDTTAKFGLGQITKPTPHWAKNAFRIVLYTVGVLNIITLTFSDFPIQWTEVINKYSAEVIIFAHAISKLFGLNLEQVDN
ncbi:MAG: hypothetical protein K0S09_6 [Sphingobacteriaceae bacterium]|jgi:predicted membrane channel-forming protein YqfA (hemolysin III family)|nr:hypothetical protein [Sphingobacteriaceae bacterium]